MDEGCRFYLLDYLRGRSPSENLCSWVLFFLSNVRFLFNKGAYLRDNWNILDFFIVVTSLISQYSSASNLSSLRTLRILRPLRTVAKVESLKKMLAAIFASFTTLKDITIIMFFFYTLYAIAGQMVFAGNLKQQCFLIATVIFIKIQIIFFFFYFYVF